MVEAWCGKYGKGGCLCVRWWMNVVSDVEKARKSAPRSATH